MQLLLPVRSGSARIGLLGGSFDPPHLGHVYISIEAIKRLSLDYLVWLVSPQNPKKSWTTMFPLQKRVLLAQNITKHPKIVISDIESHFPTVYTPNTIQILRNMHPSYQFVWIMGGDNMLQIHTWPNWQYIFDNVFVAVFDRADYAYKVMLSKAAQHYKSCCISTNDSVVNIHNSTWCFFRIKRHQCSSTSIRNHISEQL